jgi:hypothetical protein
MNWKKLLSRKFLTMIASVVLYGVNLVVLKEPYTAEQVAPVAAVVVGWLIVQGWVDVQEVKAKSLTR